MDTLLHPLPKFIFQLASQPCATLVQVKLYRPLETNQIPTSS